MKCVVESKFNVGDVVFVCFSPLDVVDNELLPVMACKVDRCWIASVDDQGLATIKYALEPVNHEWLDLVDEFGMFFKYEKDVYPAIDDALSALKISVSNGIEKRALQIARYGATSERIAEFEEQVANDASK